MGITGILSAIAIPQYNQYRERTARAAFSANGGNIIRAFQACVAVNPLSQCNTLAQLNWTCPYKAGNCSASSMGTNFCADMKTEIGGDDFKGCVQVNAVNGAVARTFSANVCYSDDNSACDVDNDSSTPAVADTASSWDGGPGCETLQTPLQLCTTNAECGATDVVCASAQNGTCASGSCN